MKKNVLGAVIGGILIFIWQFLSFALINLHEPAVGYTDKQDQILAALNSSGLEEGGYFLPALPEGSSREAYEEHMRSVTGKPWATIQYHKSYEANMIMNMIRGLLVNIVMVYLLIWIIRRLANPSFGTIVTTSLIVGLIAFFNLAYPNHIWYKTFDIWAYFLDVIVSWGLTGVVLGAIMKRRIDENTRFRAA